ncbi:unnamed protein product [Dovyalis caffra]|uniref:Uncharacterized protein n=1 Tax=Dovyalis caffra TaxID=77055 RepID=A0AAV1R7A7_9ROSI|nr:unnamed protein product [Dovyalis caffra]
MAAITKLSVLISMIMVFANVLALTSEPTIGASPAVLPYVNAPNMSSFFPPPTDQWVLGPAAPPSSEELAPVPSSGEFIGKISSSPAKFNGQNTQKANSTDHPPTTDSLHQQRCSTEPSTGHNQQVQMPAASAAMELMAHPIFEIHLDRPQH